MKNNLKVIRAKKGITQGELSKMSGIARTTLNMIEGDKTDPDGRTIAKLVKALGIPANHIFFDLNVVCKQQTAEGDRRENYGPD